MTPKATGPPAAAGGHGRGPADSPGQAKPALSRLALASLVALASLGVLLAGLVGVSADETEVGELIPAPVPVGALFGRSIAVDGSVAVAGANLENLPGKTNAGSAYVFRYDGMDWIEEQELSASDASAFDQFGISVAVWGDVAVVGAWLSDEEEEENAGSAYVFRYDGMSWVEEQKLTASLPFVGDRFGHAVAISGDWILVGAFGDLFATGAVYAFRYDGMAWMEEQLLAGTSTTDGDEFGYAIAIDGDMAVIGAPFNSSAASDAGAAYIFSYDAAQEAWFQDALLTASDAGSDDEFGHSVAISGDAALVGAPLYDSPGINPGTAYAFRNGAGGWMQEERLFPADATQGDRFGIAVSLSGDTAVIGADDSVGVFGSAYVFRYKAGLMDWREGELLIATTQTPGDHFGGSVAFQGETAIVGAFSSDVNEGTAYVFAVPEPTALLLNASVIAALANLARRRRARHSKSVSGGRVNR